MYSSHYSSRFVRETLSDRGYPKHRNPYRSDLLEGCTHLAIRVAEQKPVLRELPSIGSLTHLHLTRASNKDIEEISKLKGLTHLRLEKSSFVDFSPLANLEHLKFLFVDSNTKLSSLNGVAQLIGLEGLSFVNLPNVRDLEPISSLQSLKFFAFEGTLHKNLKVKSIAPLGELALMEALHLTAVGFEDLSLRPLSNLKSLKELKVGVFYPAEEFARLSGSLPKCECIFFKPTRKSPLKCEKGHEKVILSGKGLRDLCPDCDSGKLKKFISQFNAWQTEGYQD